MFPNNKEKYHSPSVVEPTDYLDYSKQNRKGSPSCPEKVILCYQRKLLNQIKDRYNVFQKGKICVIDFDGIEIGVLGGFFLGAPGAAIKLEEMIASGAKKIISIGSAGTLQKDIVIGDIIVVDRAIRDEGTSHHYLPSQKFVEPSKKLTDNIIKVMQGIEFIIGTSWTTDAPYRETKEEVSQYQKEGVLAVEMEAAALFAVAQYRNVEVASILMISDSLADLKWNPRFSSIDSKMISLIKYAVKALVGE